MNILFIAGPGRSGTTALANYLNQHPEILIGRERYHWVPSEVTPYSFAPENVLGDSTKHTRTPRDYHARLLSAKDPGQLKIVGDKAPRYVTELETLSENNPGARLLLLYRPIEEVIESYEHRSQNPNDRWLGGKDGFNIGIQQWNRAMQCTREFIESNRGDQALIIDYDRFFQQDERLLDLMSRFLQVDIGPDIRQTWSKMSTNYGARRRPKTHYEGEKRESLERNKDAEVEEWLLKRMEEQLDEHYPNQDQEVIEDLDSDGWHEVRKDLAVLEANAQKARMSQLEGRVETLEKQCQRQARRLKELESARTDEPAQQSHKSALLFGRIVSEARNLKQFLGGWLSSARKPR